MKIGNLISLLARHEIAKWQMILYIYVISGLGRSRKFYEQKYGRSSDEFKTEDKAGHARTESTLGLERLFEWREFPSKMAPFVWLRFFTTAYMSYVVVKYLFSNQIDHGLKLLGVNPGRPIHCYLMGRYILHESVAELMGAFFAGMFLLWRLHQSLAGPYRYNLIFFLLQTEHDRELIYARLFRANLELIEPHDRRPANASGRCIRLGRLERHHLDTMCYRVIYPNKVCLRLRANRTRESHYLLRRQISQISCLLAAIVAPIAASLFVLHMLMHSLDQRYLRLYPNCDPELEQLNAAGRLGPWSMTLTSHHTLAIVTDELENLVLWIECGLVATVAPALAYLYNFDLLLQWSGIRRKLEHRLMLARMKIKPPSLPTPDWCRPHGPTLGVTDTNYELIAEIRDFFGQISQAGQLMEQFVNVSMIGFLSLSAIVTYVLQGNSMRQIPAALVAVLAFVAVSLSLGCYTALLVHRNCSSSYTMLCSLLADSDTKRDRAKLASVTELFAKRRDCFLLMGLYPFLPTTFMTIIGWSFSCFCVISGVLHDSQLHQRLRSSLN